MTTPSRSELAPAESAPAKADTCAQCGIEIFSDRRAAGLCGACAPAFFCGIRLAYDPRLDDHDLADRTVCGRTWDNCDFLDGNPTRATADLDEATCPTCRAILDAPPPRRR